MARIARNLCMCGRQIYIDARPAVRSQRADRCDPGSLYTLMDAFTKLAWAEGGAAILEDSTAVTIRVDRIGSIPHAFLHRAYKYRLAERPTMAILVGTDVLCFVRCSSGVSPSGNSKLQVALRHR